MKAFYPTAEDAGKWIEQFFPGLKPYSNETKKGYQIYDAGDGMFELCVNGTRLLMVSGAKPFDQIMVYVRFAENLMRNLVKNK